jgi:glycosyltransferase involved in cell wall biosynthesis
MKGPILILHVCETGGVGGAESVLLNIVKRLEPGRFQSHVVLMKSGWLAEQLRAAGLEPSILPSRRSYDAGFVVRLAGRVLGVKTDLIHAHLPDAAAYACLAGALSRTPVVATYHGFPAAHAPQSRATRLKLAIVRRLARRITVVSDALGRDFVANAHFPPDRMRTIHNGIDWDEFDRPFDAGRLRRTLPLAAGVPVVGMVANVRPAKGYPIFVRAAARVAREVPGVHFVAIGETDRSLQPSLDAEVQALGLADRFHFLGARDDVPQLLRLLDVFALSSLSEGMSIATVEAMGAGLPVVVTRSGGPEELVVDGQTGLLVAAGDADALADGILKCLNDRALAAQLAHKAKIDARGRFAMQTMVSAYAALYEESLC